MSKKDKQEARTKMMRNRLIKKISIWIVLLIGGASLIFFMATSGEISDGGTVSVNTEDWVRGNIDAPVSIIEYSDFQCPACGAYYPIIKGLEEELGDKVQFVYRHFPLSQIHFHAETAARASEAAGNQGKFWEMHDRIFETQDVWSSASDAGDIFTGYASDLGLDIEQFKIDIDSDETSNRVSSDYQSGIKLGVNSTPTFYLNGEKIQNPRDMDSFRDVLLSAIKESESL